MPAHQRKVSIPGKKAEEIYAKISTHLGSFLDKTPVGKYELKNDEKAKNVSIKSGMVNGKLICRDGEVELDLQLSLFAAPFKSKLDEGIDRWIAKHFG